MKEKRLDKSRNFLRWLLLFGLLSGIFFSSGEGIRLLPFPSSPGAEQSEIKSYTLSVHNASRTHAKSQFQKVKPGSGLPVENILPAAAPGAVFPPPSMPDFGIVRRSLLVFLSGQSNRAPPLV